MNKIEEDHIKKHKDITLDENSDHLDIYDDLYTKISAINNKNRLKILFIIAEENRKNNSTILYASGIRRILFKRYRSDIGEQAVGKHLKQLLAADLIKKEEKVRSGKSNVCIYKINPMGLNRIFLELENLREDLMDFTNDFERDDFNREDQCKITVIDGLDAGKSFLLNSDYGEIRIGRLGNVCIDDPDYERDIKLSNEYEAVTKVSKPHASLKFERGKWFILEGENTNGTYINNLVLDVASKHLNNKDVIKLAQGDKGVSLLCSFN